MKLFIRSLFASFVVVVVAVPISLALTSGTSTPVVADAPATISPATGIASLRPHVTPAGAQAAVTNRTTLDPSITAQPAKSTTKKTKVIYLTFDDGPGGAWGEPATNPSAPPADPGTNYTQAVLNDLVAAGAHATFFETGDTTNIGALGVTSADGSHYPTSGTASPGFPANATMPDKLLVAGMQLGTHSWDHPDFPTIATKSLADKEISTARTEQILLTTDVTHPKGYDSKLFRYPYFDSSKEGNRYLKSQGMEAVSSDIEPNDYDPAGIYTGKPVTDQDIISDVVNRAYNGAIVDLHDATDVLARPAGPTFLPGLITALKAAGYTFGEIPSVNGACPMGSCTG